MDRMERSLENLKADEHGAREYELKAGPLSLSFSGGMIRYIKLHDEEIVRGIYVAVRDKNWGTVVPRFTHMEVSRGDDFSFTVRFTAEHIEGEIDFVWEGSLHGTPDGTLIFSMDGTARKTFLRNRIGFCILHPNKLSGSSVILGTETGEEESRFPERIAPQNPFLNITSMRYKAVDDVELELLFEGDLFETEDQRNWTDASFKTFCTPLAKPYPVQVERGESVHQRVTLRLLGETTSVSNRKNREIRTVAVGERTGGRLPKLGIGFSPDQIHRNVSECGLLNELRLDHLHLSLKLSSPDWEQLLACAARTANEIGAKLKIEVLIDEAKCSLDEFLSAVLSLKESLCGLTAYEEPAFVTSEELNLLLAAKLAKAGMKVPIGGGTRANFAEFNRAAWPMKSMDFAVYSINPQIHAFDLASIVETLEALPATVESAQQIVESLPLHVGPITFKPRVNPYAANEAEARKAEIRSNQRDERLQTWFGAGWTLGAIHQLGQAGVSAITLYEDIGELGIIAAGGGNVHPVYEILQYIGEYRGAELLSLDISHPLELGALALLKEENIRLLLANYTDVELHIELSGMKSTVGRIDDAITIPPYGVVCLDGG